MIDTHLKLRFETKLFENQLKYQLFFFLTKQQIHFKAVLKPKRKPGKWNRLFTKMKTLFLISMSSHFNNELKYLFLWSKYHLYFLNKRILFLNVLIHIPKNNNYKFEKQFTKSKLKTFKNL